MSPSTINQQQSYFGFDTISNTISNTFYRKQTSNNSLRRIDSVQDFSSHPKKKSSLTLEPLLRVNQYRSSPSLKTLHSSPASPKLNLDTPSISNASSFILNYDDSEQYTLQLEDIDDQFIIQPLISV
jgi:hypothetical protein